MEQSLQVLSRQERLEKWAGRIMECRNSGMSVRSWCQEYGLSEKTYYYWKRRLFDTLAKQKQTSPQHLLRSRLGSRYAVGIRLLLYVCRESRQRFTMVQMRQQ